MMRMNVMNELSEGEARIDTHLWIVRRKRKCLDIWTGDV